MKVYCSWSGGKDSALALYNAHQEGNRLDGLFTITTEEGPSRSHRIPESVLCRQGELMGLNWQGSPASWESYEQVFLKNLKEFKEQGIQGMVFGDIDLDEHREWNDSVCHQTGLKALHPLWQQDEEKLLQEFIDLGFKALIVCVKYEDLSVDWLGRELSQETVEQLKNMDLSPAGEGGEYHTLVVDGPLFSERLEICQLGTSFKDDTGHAFLDYRLK